MIVNDLAWGYASWYLQLFDFIYFQTRVPVKRYFWNIYVELESTMKTRTRNWKNTWPKWRNSSRTRWPPSAWTLDWLLYFWSGHSCTSSGLFGDMNRRRFSHDIIFYFIDSLLVKIYVKILYGNLMKNFFSACFS